MAEKSDPLWVMNPIEPSVRIAVVGVAGQKLPVGEVEMPHAVGTLQGEIGGSGGFGDPLHQGSTIGGGA